MSLFRGVNGHPQRGGLIKSKAQLLRDSNQKIAELEQKVKWPQERCAYLVVVVNAVGRKMELSPQRVKEIADEYIGNEQAKHQMEINESMKKEYIKSLKEGKAPPFKVIDNTQEPEPGRRPPD